MCAGLVALLARATRASIRRPASPRLTHSTSAIPNPSTHRPRRQPSTAPSLERPISQPTAHTHPHLLATDDLAPGLLRSEFVARRNRLAVLLPRNSLSLFASNSTKYMSEDVPYLYHANTDLSYIAAIKEPNSVLVAYAGKDDGALYTLFVPDRDPHSELWDGPRCGVSDGVRDYFAVDDVRLLSDLPQFLESCLPSLDSFHFDAETNPAVTTVLGKLPKEAQQTLLRKWDRERQPKQFLLPLRLIKSPSEQSLVRRCAQLMAAAFNHTLARTKATVESPLAERHIEAHLEFFCKTHGADRMAFPSVVASGPNATILHYMQNDRTARPGELVMVDAGCLVHDYCSDVSRSWPVGGRFSAAQRDMYELVLGVQRECVSMAVQGSKLTGGRTVSLDSMHATAVHRLTDGLKQLGFLKQHSVESAIDTAAYKAYFPHAIGHFLGMDVHDTHVVAKTMPLKAGMVITIEPGLYCAVDDESAPEAFRGLGMRIEDDVLITAAGGEADVLSMDAVKEPDELERLIGSEQR